MSSDEQVRAGEEAGDWGAMSNEEWEAWMLEQELRTINATRAAKQ